MAQWRKSSIKFSNSGPARGSLALTAWRQTVLAMTCSPKRKALTPCPAALSSSTNSKTNWRGWPAFDEGRQRVQQKSPLAEFAQADAQAGQRGQLFAQKLRVAGGQLDGFRQQQTLRRRGAVVFQPPHHLLEENALVGGMLVKKNQAAIGFEHDIEPANDSHQSQRHLQAARTDGAGGAVERLGWDCGDRQWGRGERVGRRMVGGYKFRQIRQMRGRSGGGLGAGGWAASRHGRLRWEVRLSRSVEF